jgi:hypothetical protein
VRDWSGQQKKAGQRGALTLCPAQTEELVRTAKESQLSEGHSPTVERRGMV